MLWWSAQCLKSGRIKNWKSKEEEYHHFENLLVHFLIEILVCLNPELVQFFSDTSSYPTFVLLFLTFFKTMISLASVFLRLIYQIVFLL